MFYTTILILGTPPHASRANPVTAQKNTAAVLEYISIGDV